VNPTPPAQARLTELAKAKGANGRAPLFDATLNLMISAPNRNFVRGWGI
jgi:translocation and assembly module TamB